MTSTRTVTNICNLALDVLKEAPLTDVDTDATPESRWFLRNYAEVRDAELREHVWKFAIRRKRLYPRDFPLAGMSGTLTGAWGLFRMIEDWSGDLVTIRRDSDNTTDDFTFDHDGAAWLVDTAEIDDFIGTGSGYVDTLFDQSGNGRSLAQATAASQPLYEEAEDETGWPALSFDGSADYLATSGNMSNLISTTAGYIVVAGLIDALTLNSATATADHLILGDNGQKIGLYGRKGGILYGYNDDGSADTITDAVPVTPFPFVAELRHLSGTLYTRVNGTTEQSATSGTTSSLASVFQVGAISNSANRLDFHLFALATFSTAPSAAERDRLIERLMRFIGAGGREEIGWGYRYPVPDDCLRMLPVRDLGDFEGAPIPHEIEQDYILTDQGSYIDARYIQQFTDPTRFDPLFVQALAGRMAMKLAHWMTGKASMAELAAAYYGDAISRATKANAFEGTPERPYDDDVIDIRYV